MEINSILNTSALAFYVKIPSHITIYKEHILLGNYEDPHNCYNSDTENLKTNCNIIRTERVKKLFPLQ